jgi:hypothetical protein
MIVLVTNKSFMRSKLKKATFDLMKNGGTIRRSRDY